MAGIPYRIGQSKEFGGSLLTTWLKSGPDSQHQVDRNMALIRAMDLPLDGTDIRLEIPGRARNNLHRLFDQRGITPGKDFIVVNPFASCAARTYDLNRMRDVIAGLAQHMPVVVTGESYHVETIKKMLQGLSAERVISLAGQTNVSELAALIDEAALLITNLTSTTHIASATGTPTVLLYPGTEYLSQWEPIGCRHEVLSNETPCMPCYRFECPLEHECMDIAPENVVETAEQLLAEEVQTRARRTA
jgi:ADP-heptose:LPS heptosyltransferase